LYNTYIVNTLIFDFSRVLLYPKDEEYKGGLNKLDQDLSQRSDYVFDDYFSNEGLIEYLNNL